MESADFYPLSEEQVQFFEKNGYIQLKNFFSAEEVKKLQGAFTEVIEHKRSRFLNQEEHWHEHEDKATYDKIFKQLVNVWQDNESFRYFTLNKRLGSVARQLTRAKQVKIFHDHALIKPGSNGVEGGSLETPWHQDFPYWPMDCAPGCPGPLSAWVAGDDVDTRNGCMRFIPSSHTLNNISAVPLSQNVDGLAHARKHLGDAVLDSLPGPVDMIMPAGSVTFHNGMLFHYANPNNTPNPRRALSIIYMPEGTTYNGKDHAITNNLGLTNNQFFDNSLFPIV